MCELCRVPLSHSVHLYSDGDEDVWEDMMNRRQLLVKVLALSGVGMVPLKAASPVLLSPEELQVLAKILNHINSKDSSKQCLWLSSKDIQPLANIRHRVNAVQNGWQS